jgi:hypothetical protein
MTDTTKKNIKYCSILFGVIIAVFVIIFLPLIIETNKTFNTLSEDGVITDCIITRYYISRTASNTYYMVECKYFVDGLIYYTKGRAMNEDIYAVGDTLKIVYIEKKPNVYRIIDPYSSGDRELWDNVMKRLAKNDTITYNLPL